MSKPEANAAIWQTGYSTPLPRRVRHGSVGREATETAAGHRENRRSQVAGLLFLLIGLSATPSAVAETGQQTANLNPEQQQAILNEAQQMYHQGREISAQDSAEASDLLAQSAEKYQLLVEDGVANSKLYVNLGNAQLQSGQLGKALANYCRAARLDPGNRQAANNLAYARSKVNRPDSNSVTGLPPLRWNELRGWRDVWTAVSRLNDQFIQTVGPEMLLGMLAIASVLFWSLALIRTAGYRIRFWRWRWFLDCAWSSAEYRWDCTININPRPSAY